MDLFQSNDALQQAVDNRMDSYQPPVEEMTQEDETIAEKADNLNKVETEREINLKKQREKYEAEIRALKDENNQLRQKNKHIPDEELVEGRHHNQLAEEVRELRKLHEERLRYETQQQQFNHLRSKYKDFDSVVNNKTLEKLKEIDPDSYEAINGAPNLKAAGTIAYRILQAMDLPETQRTEERIESNKYKPATGTGRSGALSNMDSFSSGTFSDEEKRAHWELVNRYSRGG